MRRPMITFSGFTITEVLIAVAIGSIAMAGVVAMMEQVGTTTAEQKFVYEGNNLNEDMRGLLGSGTACFNTFRNVVPSNISTSTNNAPGSTTPFTTPVYDSNGGVQYQSGGTYGDNAVLLRDMWMNHLIASPPNGGMFTVGLDMVAKAKVAGATTLARTMVISYSTDINGNMVNCVSQAKSTDGLWKMVPNTNTDIYYAAGKVGVGVLAPTYTMDIAGQGIVAMRINGTTNNAALNNTQLRFAGGKSGELWAIGSDITGVGGKDFHIYGLPAAGNMFALTVQAASGFIGINNTNPQASLQITSATEGNILLGKGYDFQYDGGNDQSFLFNHMGNAAGVTNFSGNGKQFLYLQNSDGSVGIGTTKTDAELTVLAPVNENTLDLQNAASTTPGTGGSFWLTLTQAGIQKFGISYEYVFNSYRAVVFRNISQAAAGHDRWWQAFYSTGMGGGTNADSVHFFGGTQETGNELLAIDNGNVSIEQGFLNVKGGSIFVPNGIVYANGTCTSGPCPSDRRLKDNFRPFAPGLSAVLTINPTYFRYNGLGGQEKSERDQLGVIAQDVEKGAPEIISTAKVKMHPGDKEDTEIKRVNYSALIYMVINAVKELYAKVEALALSLDSDKKEIKRLAQENSQLKAYLCARDAKAPFCVSK